MDDSKIIKISSNELAQTKTLITSFMCDRSTNIKTYSELVDIFQKCYKDFTPENDISRDLRIIAFQHDMRSAKWRGDIIITIDQQSNIVTDGIHRGIAYLRCIEEGVNVDVLPLLFVQTRNMFTV